MWGRYSTLKMFLVWISFWISKFSIDLDVDESSFLHDETKRETLREHEMIAVNVPSHLFSLEDVDDPVLWLTQIGTVFNFVLPFK